MEVPSYHPSGAKKFEVPPGFFENMRNPVSNSYIRGPKIFFFFELHFFLLDGFYKVRAIPELRLGNFICFDAERSNTEIPGNKCAIQIP